MPATNCGRCHDRLVRPDETDAALRPRVIRVYAGRLLVRCMTCGAWCPCPTRLVVLLLQVLQDGERPAGVAAPLGRCL
jgi:hypothetical protein